MRKYKYKVVNSRNRSCVVNGNSKYARLYEKDTNVYAEENSLGIMVFKTKYQAQEWVNMQWSRYIGTGGWKIKKVIPIGRGKVPVCIARKPKTSYMDSFYKYRFRNGKCIDTGSKPTITAPDGTICYPGVFVCD